MSRSSSCWRHPAKSVVGVCASCLRERLAELATAEERHASPQRLSFDSNPEEEQSKNVVTVAKLIDGDQVEADFQAQDELRRPAAILQRTHSWSHQGTRQQQRNGAYGAVDLGKAARILSSKDNSLLFVQNSTKFDSEDTPKGHTKASSWPEIDSQRQRQQQQQQQQRKGSSWLWSLLGIRNNKQQSSKEAIGSPSSSNERAKRSLFGLGKKKKVEPPPDPFADILSSPWQSGKLDKSETDEFSENEQQQQQQQQHRTTTRGSRSDQSSTNRVTPLSGNGDVLAGSSSSSKLSKMNSVNGSRHYAGGGRRHRDAWSKALSTPLRVFGKAGKKSRDELDLEAEDRGYSWYTSSPKRFHPSPAFPTSSTSYTTYYRDYGASWSLHSSPMPGKGRHHHRGGGGGSSSSSRPWENRDVFHAHPSPFHAAGSNTWNFYLTPLRPVRTSTSRHRP